MGFAAIQSIKDLTKMEKENEILKKEIQTLKK
jgi:hypothetical protein